MESGVNILLITFFVTFYALESHGIFTIPKELRDRYRRVYKYGRKQVIRMAKLDEPQSNKIVRVKMGNFTQPHFQARTQARPSGFNHQINHQLVQDL